MLAEHDLMDLVSLAAAALGFATAVIDLTVQMLGRRRTAESDQPDDEQPR